MRNLAEFEAAFEKNRALPDPESTTSLQFKFAPGGADDYRVYIGVASYEFSPCPRRPSAKRVQAELNDRTDFFFRHVFGQVFILTFPGVLLSALTRLTTLISLESPLNDGCADFLLSVPLRRSLQRHVRHRRRYGGVHCRQHEWCCGPRLAIPSRHLGDLEAVEEGDARCCDTLHHSNL